LVRWYSAGAAGNILTECTVAERRQLRRSMRRLQPLLEQGPNLGWPASQPRLHLFRDRV
jgi:hypothetical protein